MFSLVHNIDFVIAAIFVLLIILPVDDNPINLKVFESLLKKTGVQIDKAPSGKEALNMTMSNKYDIIFMDHMMPEMDGIHKGEYWI